MKDIYLHVLLITASSLHRDRSRKQFQKLNLSEGQPKVLSILLAMEGCLQKELAEECHVKEATMTSLLQNMEKNDLILKRKDLVSGGKRAYRIFFTEKGRKMAQKVNNIVGKIEEESFKGFTNEEKEQFLGLFSRVVKNLNGSEKDV